MQTLTDGYVNVNAVVLLKVDIVMHSINFKHWNVLLEKNALRNILETFHPLQNSSYLLFALIRHSKILAEHFIVERFQSLRVLHGRWQCKGTTQLLECYVSVAIC